MSFHYGTERSLCRPELATEESMDARRAALRDRIPAELDIIGIEIPAGSWGRLLQDSIAARIVQKRVGGVARDAEVVAQSDLRGNRRCGAELRVPYDKITQYSHRVTHIITGSGCGEGGAPGERDSHFAIRIRRQIGIHKSIVIIPNLPLRYLGEVRIARGVPSEPDLGVGAARRACYRVPRPAK